MNNSTMYTLSATELLVLFIELPMSAINIFLVARTSLIHFNLKMILQYQSLCILIRSIGRAGMTGFKFLLKNPMDADLLEPFRFFYQFGLYNRNFVFHVLIVERIMATVMVRSYERRRSWIFTILWSIVVSSCALYNVLALGKSDATLTNVITNSALIVLAIVELSIFAYLWFYNERKYKEKLGHRVHNLSERYQLSENIRIAKQLTPTLLVQMVQLTWSTFCFYYVYFGWPNAGLLNSLVIFTSTIIGLIIEFTIVWCHPFLKRDLFNFYDTLISIATCQRPSRKVANIEQTKRSVLAMRDILSGRDLLNGANEPEEHFAALREMWEKNSPNRAAKCNSI